MNIGIEIQLNQILAAASEEENFTILEKFEFSEMPSFTQTAEWIALALPAGSGDSIYISIPSCWQLTHRKLFTEALHETGLTQYTLVPDCIAALAGLQHQRLLPENFDLVYVSPLDESNMSKSTFSFISGFAGSPSPLWEGSFIGDYKFLRKMANTLGYLYKGKWSEHLFLCGIPEIIQNFFPSSTEKELPLLPINAESILQGITVYQPELHNLLAHLHYRCHSRFYLQKISSNTSETVRQSLPFSTFLLPLPWNDYNCFYFFTPIEKISWEFYYHQTWELYEKPLYANEEKIFKIDDLPSLFSFYLEEPSSLWLSSHDGTMELLPFMENTPQIHENIIEIHPKPEYLLKHIQKTLAQLSDKDQTHL